MPKRKRKKEEKPESAAASPESTAVSEADDTELIAVITAAVAAARAEEASVPVITAVREREAPEQAAEMALETDILEASREEETINPADSFTARTIKRRDKRKYGRSPRL